MAYVETGVRIPVGTPTSTAAQAAESTGDKPEYGLSPASFSGDEHRTSMLGEAVSSEISPPNHLDLREDVHKDSVPLRSKPITIAPLTKKSGKMGFRVTGTLTPGGKQQKRIVDSIEDAEELRLEWELIRSHGASAARPKVTTLTRAQIAEVEPLYALIKGENVTLTELVKLALQVRAQSAAKSQTDTNRTFRTLYDTFLPTKANGAVSDGQYDNYRIRATSFGNFYGWDKPITAITWETIDSWLRSRKLESRKSWNNYRNDLSALFAWAVKAPRKWLSENPADGVIKYKTRSLPPRPRLRFDIPTCEALMRHVEEHAPAWCTYYAIALFTGIRPDMRTGEMNKLARCIERDGLNHYHSNGCFHLTREITKDRSDRTVHIPSNLAAWLEKYPPTPKNIRPGDYKDSAPIRKKFHIAYDCLRHTAISAYVSMGHSYSEAADEFGNSEGIIREHYMNRMSRAEAEAFYQIMPRPTDKNGPTHPPPTSNISSHPDHHAQQHIPQPQ